MLEFSGMFPTPRPSDRRKINSLFAVKKRLTRTACTRNNNWMKYVIYKKKSCCCRLVVSIVLVWLTCYNFGYQTGNTRAIAVAPVRTILIVASDSDRSVGLSVGLCLSVASRKPRDRETLGRPSISTREDLPPARWETSAVRSAL